ncbi:IS1562 truncated transposase [Streptococcus dysgalactiae subsp. equisimilis GGS_124]|nr:IS1562 truncated transposase [Streptococcus dysgalactiae subsp. equisimilis GGS_124]
MRIPDITFVALPSLGSIRRSFWSFLTHAQEERKTFIRLKELIYDEHSDRVMCPEHQALTYRALRTREGYREYKSDPAICANCHPVICMSAPVRTTKKLSHGIFEKRLLWNSARTLVIKGG